MILLCVARDARWLDISISSFNGRRCEFLGTSVISSLMIMIMIACRTTLFLATGACTIIRLSLLIIREWIAQLLILFWEYKTPNATFSCKQLYFAYISAYTSTTLRIDWILYLKYTVCCNRAIAYALLRMYLYILLRNISFFFFC